MNIFAKILILFLCFAYSISFANGADRELVSLAEIYKNENDREQKLLKAKELREDKSTPVIAVIDCGILYKDPRLAYKILRPKNFDFTNYLTKSNDKQLKIIIDELGGDEYDIDAFRAWIGDFKNSFYYDGYLDGLRSSIYDGGSPEHGTVVASVISSNADEVLILPIAGDSQLFRFKGKDKNIISAMNLAAIQKPEIINISLCMHSLSCDKSYNYTSTQSYEISQDFREIIINHPEILFVIAAGNNSENINGLVSNHSNLPNVILVGAVDSDRKLTDYSNYGSKVVDVAAFGEAEWSGEIYKGTSFAGPRVSALAAEIKRINPALSALQIKEIICDTVDKTDELKKKLKYGGVINKKKAISLSLDMATALKSYNIAQMLIDAGADIGINEKKEHDYTPIYRIIGKDVSMQEMICDSCLIK